MHTPHTVDPTLLTFDWNSEWIELQKARRHPDDPTYWDERAKNFHKDMKNNPYVDAFIDYMEIAPGDTVLDMGCGNGALSIPLAEMGHPVIAADFSQGMLNSLKERAQLIGGLPIQTHLMGWEDNWEAQGIEEKCVDIAVASRSIATENLGAALAKLTHCARRRCCITLSAGSSPRADARILGELGLKQEIGRDFVYAFMILIQHGFDPEVRYITNFRTDHYEHLEDLKISLTKMVEDACAHDPAKDAAQTLAKLDPWLEANVIEEKDVQGKVTYHLRHPRKISWAFLAWNITEE